MEMTNVLIGLGLGGGMILIGIVSIFSIMITIGICLSLIFLKTRQIIVPHVTLFILNLLETPIKYLLWIVGIEEDLVGLMIIEIRNRLYRDRYEKTPYENRVIFLPQCVRNSKCPAPLTPEGIICIDCGKCGVGVLKEEAEALGYKVFIAPGSSLIKRMVKKYHPKAILGVGCTMEVKEGTSKMASYGLPVQGIILDRDGCVDTRVDIVKLLGLIKAVPKYSINSDEKYLKKASKIQDMWREEPEINVHLVDSKKIEREN